MILVFIFLFGLIMGSFYNVLISRVPHGQSIVTPSSYCPLCLTTLKAVDLIPLFSFLFFIGKCRYCCCKISARYPIVELLTAFLFVFSWYQVGELSILLVIYWVLFSSLIISFFTDIENMTIPNMITYPSLAVVLVLQFLNGELLHAVLGAALCFGFLLFAGIISKGGMGGGDIKLAAVIGAALGPIFGIISIMFASIAGTVIGLGFIISGIRGRKDPICFAPFMLIGTVVSVLLGDRVIHFLLG